jgi:cytochrome c5
MKTNMLLVLGLVLLLSGIGGLWMIRSYPMSMDGMGMMGQADMKEMMKRMMGDQLPPAIKEADLPEPESRGARLVARYCTRCHDLPSPALHTSSEWPKVLARMDKHVEMMAGMSGIPKPSQEERETLLHYLQRYAADAQGG